MMQTAPSLEGTALKGPMSYHPQRFGGVQIRDNGRAIGSMTSKAAAKALCDAINAREQPKRAGGEQRRR